MKRILMGAVRRVTRTFFKKHWSRKDGAYPKWSKPWTFKGPIPNGETRGVYALLEGENVVYIGIGAKVRKEHKQTTDRYPGHGLNARLKKGRIRRIKRPRTDGNEWKPVKKWKKISTIHTIGFPVQPSCLAFSLEAYLIEQLRPRENQRHNPAHKAR